MSCSKIILVDVFRKAQLVKPVCPYAIMDNQSNASMISPILIWTFTVDGPKEKYLLSTCSSSKETKYGRRISQVLVKGLNSNFMELPTMIEM